MYKEIFKQWVSFLTFTPLILGPACLISKPFPKQAFKLMQLWSKIIKKISKYEVNIIDRNTPSISSNQNNNKRGILYVHLNQQTLLSMPLYLSFLPFNKTVMNIEFALLPFIGWCPTLIGGVPIIRQMPNRAKQSLENVVQDLKSGESYCISIEGKRCGPDGNLSPYKKGPIVLAIESQCDIVPFLTFGEFQVWPYGKSYTIPGGKIDIVVLPKISTVGLTFEKDRNNLLNSIRSLAEQEKKTWEQNNREYIISRKNIISI